MDGLGSNIDIHIRGSDTLRILPRINEEVNEEWISDKARHAFDGLKK
jgi:NADH dehydrogenase/NADH:ubiquinone oxidoreductase subunit G